MNVIVASLLWILLILYTFRVRSRPDNSMYVAIGLIAVAMTTNIDSLYLAASEHLPIPNMLSLIGNLAMLVGVFYLARAIQRGAMAIGGTSGSVGTWTRWGTWVAAGLMIVGFSATDAPSASTTFMLDYGDQPAAAIYSLAQFIFLGGVLLSAFVICRRNVPHMRQKRFRAGFRIIIAGCLTGIALCVSVVVMDVLHLLGEITLMRAVGGAYDSFRLLTVVLLGLGLAIPPVVRQIERYRRDRALRPAASAIGDLWRRTVAQDVEFSLAVEDFGSVDLKDIPQAELPNVVHRMIIEINDWMALTRDEVSEEDRRTLTKAERLFTRQKEVSR